MRKTYGLFPNSALPLRERRIVAKVLNGLKLDHRHKTFSSSHEAAQARIAANLSYDRVQEHEFGCL